ncbi:MAG: hypothetical protein WBM50_13520 [Acidimicrobiales bacterium]
MRFARWWVQRYTAGLPDHESVSRRAEIDSDLAEHAQCRQLDGWAPKQITGERLRRLVRGMAADLSWRHELVTGHCRTRSLVRMSVLSVTSVAAVTLAMFHFLFAAYLLGNTSLAELRFLGGLDNYAEEVGRPIASMIAALVIAGLGLVLLAAGLARPVSPLIANVATVAIAGVAVMFFWLGVWPVALVAVLGSTIDLATRTPNPTSQP